MLSLSRQLDEAARAVAERSPLSPRIGVVLGSGLGAFGDALTDLARIPYREIPHMPAPTVSGHAGNLCLGRCGRAAVACLQGRVHAYEGHDPNAVVFGVRLLARLGCEAVLLTNAAGGIREAYAPGTLMLVTDHLNLSGHNPLVGPNDAALGPRFPDMTRAYDPTLSELCERAAESVGVALAHGVYAALLGPSYETPAEIHMLRALGADAVGMSTALEAIALRHLGVRVAAVSCITNLAAGISKTPLDHADVEATAARVRADFSALLAAWIERIASFCGGASSPAPAAPQRGLPLTGA